MKNQRATNNCYESDRQLRLINSDRGLPGEDRLHKTMQGLISNGSVCDRHTGYNHPAIAPFQPSQPLPPPVKWALEYVWQLLEHYDIHDAMLKSAIAIALGKTWQDDLDRFHADFEDMSDG